MVQECAETFEKDPAALMPENAEAPNAEDIPALARRMDGGELREVAQILQSTDCNCKHNMIQ